MVGGGNVGQSSSSTCDFSTITLSFQLILCCLTRLHNSFYLWHLGQANMCDDCLSIISCNPHNR